MLQFFPLRSPTLPPIRGQPFAFNFSIIILSVTTFCLLSTFCCFTIVINCFIWFFTNIIGGGITKIKEEMFNMSSGESKNSAEGGFTAFRNSTRSDYENRIIDMNDNEFDHLYSERGYVLAPAELSYMRCEKKKKSSNSGEQYTPDIPSPLNPERPKDIKDVGYYPSERHAHRSKPKSRLSLTDKMIESTAAYRVGKQWQDGNVESCTMKKSRYEIKSHQQHSLFSSGRTLSLVPREKPYDFCDYSESIQDLNVRLDQEQPNLIVHGDRLRTTLQYTRKISNGFDAPKKR